MGTSYTDLDLSGTIGAQKTLVFLKVVNNESSNRHVKFRPNGCTEDVGDTSTLYQGSGATNIRMTAGECNFIIIMTDSSGIIEHKCKTASSDIDVFLMGYIK